MFCNEQEQLIDNESTHSFKENTIFFITHNKPIKLFVSLCKKFMSFKNSFDTLLLRHNFPRLKCNLYLIVYTQKKKKNFMSLKRT